MNTNVKPSLNWEVLEYDGNSTSAKSIKRLSDNVIFTIGDLITNSYKMKGKITKFSFSFRDYDVSIFTTWSGVGMGLEMAMHVPKLPSLYQIGDEAVLKLGGVGVKILAVHFTPSKVKYDIEFELDGEAGRLYNVDENFIKEF